MTGAQHRGSPADDGSAVQTHESCGYDELRQAIADDLATLKADHAISLPRLVSDLFLEIESARATGQGFAAIATVFTHRGVPASSDAVRVAHGRERKRRSEEQPVLERGKKRQTRASSPPTAPPIEIQIDTPADTSAENPEPARETPPTPPRVGVGRHLD